MGEETARRRRGRPRTIEPQAAAARAMEAWWSEGIQTLSLNEVCRRANLSKPALYREFGGEDGLMEAALAQYDQAVVQPVLQAVGADRPFPELVERLIVGMTAARETPAGCLFTEMRLTRGRLGARTDARVRAMQARRREVFEDWFRRARSRGEVSDSVAPELAAQYIDAQIAHVLMQVGAGEPPEAVAAQARLAFGALLA